MIEDELRKAFFGLVPEVVAMVRAELERPRMIPIKSAIVSYRQILDAENRGELTVYRPRGTGKKGNVGHAAFVDEAELYAWIRRTGGKRDELCESHSCEEHDDVDRVIEMNERRRRRTA